ncbi:MAG: FAD-dependent oxidoreductase, partial [Leptospiraceae bacterium]|nr:FAD-dependent oxidoreductase [Leptospiraceae bacterium]
MSEKTIVVVGGAMAGPVAAARAREIDEKARIILLERNSRVSYAAGSLGLYLSGEVTSLEDLNREKAEFFRDVYNIEAWTHTNVTAINAGQHTIQIDRSGDAQTLHYNSLVYALGAESIVPDNISSDLENVALFRTLNDLEKIERNLNQGQRVCVIGSGPFGLEAAGALIRRGATVTVLEKESRLYPEADSFISAAVQLTLESKARIVTGAQVESYRVEGARVRSLVLNDKTEIETDLVILAAGILPRTALLQKAGANLTEQQTIRVDTNCRTNLPDIYACGVCVSLPQVLTGEPIWIPQVASADKSAQVAGANAAGLNLQLPPVCGT